MNARELGVSFDLIQPGEMSYPNARTDIPVIYEVHPVALSEDSILFCCHAETGEEQTLDIQRDFIADLIEEQDNEAIQERVIAYANRVASASWN